MEVPLVDGLLFALGVAVWIGLAVVARRAPRSVRLAPLPDESPHALRLLHLLWVFGVYVLAGMVAARAAGPLPEEPGAPDPFAGVRLALHGAAAPAAGALACLLVAAVAWRGGIRGWGLNSRRLGRNLLWALAAFVAVLPVVYGVARLSELAVLRIGRGDLIHDHEAIVVLRDPALAAWARGLVVLNAALLAPLGEELFWRGLVQPWAGRTLGGRGRGIVLASILFGVVHLPQPIAVVPLILMALVLGYTYERTGSLWTPILVHMLFNIRTLIISAPQWLWPESVGPGVVGG